MIRINLLPQTERKSDWSLTRLFEISGGFLAVTLMLIYALTACIVWQKERETSEVRNQYELLRPTEAAMHDSLSKQQLIIAKNDILVILTKERKSWHAIIARLATLTTPRLWFTELGAVNTDSIKIIGIADNYQEIAVFLQRLEQDAVFIEPSLVQAEITTINSNKTALTKFEIVVKVKGLKQ